MAEHMQAIKRQIKSISSTERVTNAMKLVSASKLRKAKAVYEHNSRLLKKIADSLEEAFDNADDVPKELLLGSREIKTTCYFIITSSMGFCGSYNGNVIRETEEIIAEEQNKVKLATIGNKGKDHFSRVPEYELIMAHDESPDTVSYDEVRRLAHDLIDRYRKGEIDEIVLVYTSFINTLRQEVVSERLLPIDLTDKLKGKGPINEVEYIPSAREVFAYLTEEYLVMKLYNATIEAATCEYASRRSAMENATKNANDMLDDLELRYSRARQAQITDEIIEVVSGSEAQNG